MKYCIANNYGHGFFTNEDRKNFILKGHPGNLWVVEDNEFGNAWIKRVNGVELTKEEGETMLNEILKNREEIEGDHIPSINDSKDYIANKLYFDPTSNQVYRFTGEKFIVE